jgi:hypothetical protein
MTPTLVAVLCWRGSAEPASGDRADFHRQFNAQMLEFLRKHLPSRER